MSSVGNYPYLAQKAAERVDDLEHKLAHAVVGAVFTTGFAALNATIAYLTDDPVFGNMETGSSILMGFGALYFFNAIPKIKKRIKDVQPYGLLYQGIQND